MNDMNDMNDEKIKESWFRQLTTMSDFMTTRTSVMGIQEYWN